MKNRAKCKLCLSIIESFHSTDFITCKCGEIALDGGDALRCFARDFKNFLRVDDQGNEITVTVKDDSPKPEKIPEDIPVSTREDKIKMLDEMIKRIDDLPSHALLAPITHYDFYSMLILISSILKEN